MKKGDLELVRANTAAKIIRILDARKLSTRDAEKLTGVPYSEFSRIRNTQLGRFTLDRMIAILGKLDEDVEVSVSFRVRKHGTSVASRAAATAKRGYPRAAKAATRR